MCSFCTCAFHISCVQDVDEIPRGDWECAQCKEENAIEMSVKQQQRSGRASMRGRATKPTPKPTPIGPVAAAVKIEAPIEPIEAPNPIPIEEYDFEFNGDTVESNEKRGGNETEAQKLPILMEEDHFVFDFIESATPIPAGTLANPAIT